MKIGICEWNIPVSGISNRVEWAAKAGLKAIEFDLGNIGGQENLLRELSNQWNIEVPTLGINTCCSTSMCHPENNSILHQAFEDAVNVAVDLTIPKLQVPSFCESFIRTDEDFNCTVENFRFLCRISEGTDLIIGTENALTAAQQLDLLNRVECDRLKIYFDTRNLFSMQGYDAAAILEKLYPHLCEIHLKDGINDGPSCALGEGNSGFHACMKIMKDHKFDGWYLLENDYKTIEECKIDIRTASAALNSEI